MVVMIISKLHTILFSFSLELLNEKLDCQQYNYS